MDNDTESVELDSQLVQRIEGRVGSSDFESVREYIEFTMETVLGEVEATNETDESESSDPDVQERLASLGYVDE